MKEVEFFTFFHLLREIRRVLSAKMASNQLKISQKFDLDSFQGIDWHRELVLLQKSPLIPALTSDLQLSHKNVAYNFVEEKTSLLTSLLLTYKCLSKVVYKLFNIHAACFKFVSAISGQQRVT